MVGICSSDCLDKLWWKDDRASGLRSRYSKRLVPCVCRKADSPVKTLCQRFPHAFQTHGSPTKVARSRVVRGPLHNVLPRGVSPKRAWSSWVKTPSPVNARRSR
jgi:hypothetical protein